MNTWFNKTILGIDPGTRIFGMATIHQTFKNGPPGEICLSMSSTIEPPKKFDLRQRIKFIGDMISVMIRDNVPDLVCIEQSTYKGKAENSFKRLLGVLEYVLPEYIPILHVNPATLKKHFGHGSFDKLQVAQAVLNRFPPGPSRDKIDTLIKRELWDQTDAIAVSLFGLDSLNQD